ncbi:hypothetical protein F0L74_06070 [Chitinophaga agrisoli]|uniref:Uncharacterized protein n=1 Tax=Chitinophaga agrisoli TaxID=2607653 RepID=A0A5B2W0I9_9BACT|nr:hypothetical protein [Chitinophaga agrisoli]KAA2245523.1 hypothetical protein F0L74_06070 [Chitinophaga agrisoli]
MNYTKRDNRRAAIVKMLADKYGVSTSYIYRVLKNGAASERILSDYMMALEGTNNLLEAVKKAVPFD